MACATCGTSILFGGKKAGARKYCSRKCLEADELGRVSDTVPQVNIDALADQLRHAQCPTCQGTTGLEMFKSYFVYSIVILTSWKEEPQLSCRSCAKKRQLRDMLASCFLGWWGIPFGLIVTPIMLVMNGVAMVANPLDKGPSKQLKEYARLVIANEMLSEQKGK